MGLSAVRTRLEVMEPILSTSGRVALSGPPGDRTRVYCTVPTALCLRHCALNRNLQFEPLSRTDDRGRRGAADGRILNLA